MASHPWVDTLASLGSLDRLAYQGERMDSSSQSRNASWAQRSSVVAVEAVACDDAALEAHEAQWRSSLYLKQYS